MKLTSEQILHIATLSRLELSEEEKITFGLQLSSILDYVGKLSEVKTEGVEPMHHSIELHNVFGVDEANDADVKVREGLLAAFPEREGDLLRVKAVF